METKLTLRLNKEVIEEAKKYALSQNISMSKMIETYLKSIVKSRNQKITITPLVESISGIIQLDEDIDYKKDYNSFLKEKYK